MNLNHETYYTPEADRRFMSNSQYKGWHECPARQWAKLNGKWHDEETTAMLIGKYVDNALLTPDALNRFVEKNRAELFTAKGDKPRAETIMADSMIARCERDKDFMTALDGQHQELVTFEMFGVKWRSLFDAVDYKRGTLVDLKTCKDFEPVWDNTVRAKLPFYERFGYWIQLAIYREAYKSVAGCYPKVTAIAAVTKQKHPRLKVIVFDNDARFQHELERIEANLPDILKYRDAKSVDGIPQCGQCDYCAEERKTVYEMAESLSW
jgi:hypothetical protein